MNADTSVGIMEQFEDVLGCVSPFHSPPPAEVLPSNGVVVSVSPSGANIQSGITQLPKRQRKQNTKYNHFPEH